MKALYSRVKDLVSDEREPLKFFTTVETPLDVYHGVDAFFTQGKTSVATIDISMKEKDVFKSDVVLVVRFDNTGKPSAKPEEIQAAAQAIARKLNQKTDKQQAN